MSRLQIMIEQLATFFKPFSIRILLFLFLTPFLIKWLLNKNPRKRKNLPPSPPKLPLIGNLHQLGTYPHRSLQKLSKKYGPIFSISLGTSPAVVISSPIGAREIMQTHDLIFANRFESKIFKKLIYNMQDVSTAPYGEKWRKMKSICNLELLSKKSVLSFRTLREEETAVMMNMIKDQSCGFSKPVNLSELFSLIMNKVVCRAAFGRKYDSGEEGSKLRNLLLDFFGLIGTANVEDFLPWFAWINSINGTNATADRVAKEFDEFLEGVLKVRLDNLKKAIEQTDKDFLDILIGFYKDEESPDSLNRENVKAIILDMIAGGTDTSSTVLEWAMTELLRQPKCMKKLQDEVRAIGKGKENINEDDLEKMPYLKALMKETLRYYPPIPTIVPRKSTEDVKLMGYDVPAGTVTIINAWAIARDPTLWDDPEEFKPERFLNSSLDFRGQDFEFIPFGSGRRGCPGISFAMFTNEIVLANMVHMFDWALPDGMKGEDLDMTECTGLTIHRKVPLFAIPSPSHY